MFGKTNREYLEEEVEMGDHERCNNCRRDIPAANYRMHSLHCARNIALCPVCDEPVPRGELEEHQQELHSSKQCNDCGEKIEASKLEEHKSSLCPKRIEICMFCACNQEMSTMKEHVEYCGSRTEKCEDCKEIIMLKNWERHIESNHTFIKLSDEAGPKPSWVMEEDMKRRNQVKCDYMSPLWSSRPDPRYEDPRVTSTTAQRKNFTDTELFNNQDIYSSKRYAAASTAPSSTPAYDAYKASCSAAVYTSASSSNVSKSIQRSPSSSIVNSVLNKSSSSSIVNSVMNKSHSTASTSERKSSVKVGENGSYSTQSASTASIVGKVLANNKDVANAHVNGSTVEEEKLPCEFCEAMIPMYKLHSHQAQCVNTSNVRGLGRASSMRETSNQREATSGVDRSATSSRVNRYLRQSSIETPIESDTPSLANDSTPNRKISPTNASIVNKYVSNQEKKTTAFLPESPPHYDQDQQYSSHYLGRSSYLKEERSKEERKNNAVSKPKPQPVVAGMYENDRDREALRQALSGLRKCPMDLEDDPNNNDGSYFPCEFCGDPYPSEFLMRHQMSCDLNPAPVSSGNGFDYNSIKNNITRTVQDSERRSSASPRSPSVMPERRDSRGTDDRRKADQDDERTEQILANTRRLSRSNSVIEHNINRSTVRASSVSRTSSFADRSYGTRTNLATSSSFSIADYTSAVRRSSVFDGYAGYSIYSSISEGLDQITYGGRTSRRNSITETNYSLSRRGSFSTRNDLPLAALQASLEASKALRDEDRSDRQNANDHVNGQASSYLQNGHHSHLTNGFSRQNSSQGDSPKTIESPFGATSGSDLARSESKKGRRRASIKHSQSGYKLERRVSFHDHAQVIGDNPEAQLDENGMPIPDKPKRKRTDAEKEARRKEKEERRERKEAKRAARGASKDRKCQSEGDMVKQAAPPPQNPKQTVHGGELLEQVSQKLAEVERQQRLNLVPSTGLAPLPASSLLPIDSQASSLHNHKASDPHNAARETPSTFSKNAPNLHNGHADVQTTDNKLTLNETETVCKSRKTSKGPAPKPPVDVVDDLVKLDDDINGGVSGVAMREHSGGSKACSQRNSLDNKSVQSLAKDLAAECAKAYELMESSLSKLTNDFSIGGPFGLTPKSKKKSFVRPAPPLK